MIPARDIAAVVLAGGRASRMGGRDKGLLEIDGRPLAARVLDAVSAQVGEVVISANRNQAQYARLGVAVVADPFDGFQGPLAGVLAGLEATARPYLLTVPCDAPELPRDLAERLAAALAASGAEVAVAHDGERLQPMHALLSRSLGAQLRAALTRGERGAGRWYSAQRCVTVDFAERRALFRTLNTPQDWDAFNRGE